MIYPNSVDPKAEETEIVLQADKSAFKAKKVGMPMSIGSGNGLMNNGRNRSPGRAGINMMRRDASTRRLTSKRVFCIFELAST